MDVGLTRKRINVILALTIIILLVSFVLPGFSLAADTTPPTTALITTPASPNGDNGWFKTTPSITLTRNEPGVTYYSWISNIGPWTTYVSSFNALEGQNILYYYSRDIANNSELVKSQIIKVDTTTPIIELTYPANSAVDVPLAINITATFLENMNRSTINNSTFTLKDNMNNPVSGTVAYDSATKKAIFNPDSDLAETITYTATITTGVKDVAGNNMASNYTWSFTSDPQFATIAFLNPSAGQSFSLGIPVQADGNGTISHPQPASFRVRVYWEGTSSGPVNEAANYEDFLPVVNLLPDPDTFTWTTTTGYIYTASGSRVIWAYIYHQGWSGKDLSDSFSSVQIYIPPTTTLTTNPASNNGDNGWFKTTTPTVTLTISEPGTTYYKWDSSPPQGDPSWTTYSTPFSALEGEHVLYYYSQSATGNNESVKNQVIKTDTVLPVDPTLSSPSHIVGSLSNDTTINVNWSGATDASSGVDGYSILWNNLPSTTPDNIKDFEETSSSTTSAPLADGTWYAHLRTKDNAGNWTATAHLGPFYIETDPPGTTLTTSPASFDGDNSWFKTTPSITLTRDELGTTYYKWDSTALPGDPSWITYVSPFSGLEGEHTLYYYSRDVAGNNETINSQVIKTDTTPPIVFELLSPINGYLTNNTSPTLSWNASSDVTSNIAKYQLYIDGSLNRDNIPAGSTSTTPTSALSNGSHTWYIKAIDNAGNARNSTSTWTINIDTTAPTVSSTYPTNSSIDFPVANNLTVTFSESMDASTINILTFTLNGGLVSGAVSYNPATNTATFNPDSILAEATSYTATITTGVRDSAGNYIASNYTWSFNTTNPPTTTLTTVPAGPNGDNSWFKITPTITLTINEPGTTYYKWDSTALPGDPSWTTYGLPFSALEGNHTLYYYSQDTAGNNETVKSQLIKTDTVLPVDPTLSSTSHTVGNPSNDTTINVNWSGATDASSSVDGYSIEWNNLAISTPDNIKDFEETSSSTTSAPLADGTWYAHLRTKDNAGNWTATVHLGPFYIETDPPGTTLTTSPVSPNGNNNWFVTTPSITLTSDESGTTYYKWNSAGPPWTTYTIPFNALEGSNTLYYYSQDIAGNNETVNNQLIKVDTVNPVVFNLLSPINGYLTNNTSPTLSWNASSDVTSNIAKYQLYIDGSLNRDNIPAGSTSTTPTLPLSNGLHTWYIRAIDNAGNARNSTSTWTIDINTITPTISSTYPTNLSIDFPVANNITATFSKSMDASTINNSTFNLKDSLNNPVLGTVSYNSGTKTATFNPIVDLAIMSSYTATVTTGARDSAGNYMALNYTWSFSTTDLPTTTLTTSPAPPGGNYNNWFTTTPSITLTRDESGITYYSWNSAGGPWTTYTVPFSALEGSNTLYFYSQDTAGNNETVNNQLIKVDTVNPVVFNLLSPINGYLTNNTSPTLSWNASSDVTSNIAKYQLYIDGSLNRDNIPAGSTSTTPTSALSNGSHTWYIKAIDGAGNTRNSTSTWTINIDTTAPTVSSTYPTNGTMDIPVTNNLTATFSESMDASTISNSTFILNGGSVSGTVTYNSAANTATFNPNSDLAEAASYTVTVTTGVKDSAGNNMASNYVWSFTTTDPPTTTLTTNPAGPNGDDSWFKTTPTITLTRDESGTTYYKWNSAGPPWTPYSVPFNASEGQNTIYYYSQDTAGNNESVKNQLIKVDTVLPVDPTLSSTSHVVGGWSNDTTIDVNLSGATDATSGIDGYSIEWNNSAVSTPDTIKDLEENGSSFTSPSLSNGTWYVHLRTKDNAGNWTSTANLGPFNIDTNPPGTTLNTNPGGPNGDNGWFRISLPSITLTRDESGITYYSWISASGPWTTYSGSFNASEGQSTLYYYSQDTAGNNESVKSQFIKTDTVIPVDPTLSSSSHIVGGWSNDTTIDINWSGATDATSGVDGYSIEWNNSAVSTPDTIKDLEETASSATSPTLTGGTWYAHLRTKDNAGNWTATAHLGPFNIETDPPTTTLTTNPASPNGPNNWFITTPSITLTSDEAGTTYYSWVSDSGPWTTYAGSFNAMEGQNTLYYYSRDLAGNDEVVNNQLIKVDTVNPSSSISSPSAGAYINGVTYTITGTSADSSGINKVEVSINGGAWQLAIGTTSWSYTWTLPADGNYNIKSRATDNLSTVEVPGVGVNVTVDNTPPTVSSTYPTDLAVDIPMADNITVTFSENMNPSSFDTSTFTLKDIFNNPVSGTVSYNPATKTAVFNPVSDLAEETTYIATINTGVEDLAGNNMSSNYIWSFTSVDIPTTTLTTVVAVPDGNDDWFITIPSVTLTSDEPGTTYYSLVSAGGPWITYAGSFDAPEGQNTVYFYSQDTAGNNEVVKNQLTKRDTVLSVDPTLSSSSHVVGGWSNDTTIDINWFGATDVTSGVDGYSIEWNNSATGTPDAVKDLEETSFATTSQSLADGTWYAHLRTKDNAGNWTSTAHLGPFYIETDPPTTILTTSPVFPSGPDNWFITIPSITLTSDELGTTYYSWVSASGPWTTYSGSFNAPQGQNTIYYYSRDIAGNNETVNSKLIKVDTINPSSAISSPITGSYINGATYTVTGTSADSSGINKVEVSINGGAWQLATGTTSWSYIWTLPADGAYNIKSRATDNIGTVETPGAGVNVTVDNTPPTVTSTYPTNSAIDVPVADNITVTFSESMKSTTIGSSTFTLKDSLNNPVSGTVTYNPATKTATFNPTSNLIYSTALISKIYTATVATGVTDLAGNGLVLNKVWSFTTEIDTFPPITTLVTDPSSPNGGGGWFATTPTITLTANEPATIYYSWDSATGPWITYSAPFNGLEGEHTLYYYSLDTAGNSETAKSKLIKLDSSLVPVTGFNTIYYLILALLMISSGSTLVLCKDKSKRVS